MAKFKTVLHHYYFESSSHPQYKAMVERIKANADGRGHWMNSHGGREADRRNDSETVEIESTHLFGNQWNEADPGDGKNGRRLFDWFEQYELHSRNIKRGHWLEITPEMAEARRLTLKCGYCGHQYGPHHDSPTDDGFCRACLDSPYLEPKQLYLLRLLPVAEVLPTSYGTVDLYHADLQQRAELTEAERSALMPSYVLRQTTGADSRAKKVRDKQRADVLEKFRKETHAATAERDGMLWLWEKGLNLDNVIYYSHTDKFGFGWRSPVSKEVEAELMKIISEFPHAYEIKTADGRKLEGY